MRRIVATSFVGNVLELFDFAAYGYFAAVIGRQFFPADNPTVSLMASLGVFAAGFIARPIGGILFGHVADRIGRAPALLGSVALMAISTFLIGLLPTYAQIGAAAPILLVVMRLLQGASVGGEFTTSVVYAVEHAPPHRRGRGHHRARGRGDAGDLQGDAGARRRLLRDADRQRRHLPLSRLGRQGDAAGAGGPVGEGLPHGHGRGHALGREIA
jgi:MHS family proline/betaine transporter-like MFS transporter